MEMEIVLQTLTLAIFFGLIAQVISERLKVPSIIPLMLIGIASGPAALNLIHTDKMEAITETIITLGVAVILFEGGMSLSFKNLQLAPKAIINIISVGTLITFVLSSIAIHYCLGVQWDLSLLTGSILTVTGPTVIVPLLKRIKVTHKIEDLLMWEGILIDPVGVILSVVVLNIILADDLMKGATVILFIFRIILGIAMGLLTGNLLKKIILDRLVGEEILNLVILAILLFSYWFSNLILSESGILAVTIAGIVLAQMNHPVIAEVKRFKDQLSLLILSVLFILLSARLDLVEMAHSGWGMLGFLAIILFVIRPLNIFCSTVQCGLSFKEKLFLSWVAPRGIIAASTASLYAILLLAKGYENAQVMENIIFLVIMFTVLLQGLTAGYVAKLLGVQAKPRTGYLFVGIHEFSLALGKQLTKAGIVVKYIDSIEEKVRRAQEEGLFAIQGNALDEKYLKKVGLEEIGTMMSLTTNDQVNIVASSLGEKLFGKQQSYQVINSFESEITDTYLYDFDRALAFDMKLSLDTINTMLRSGSIYVETVDLVKKGKTYEYPSNIVHPLFLLYEKHAKMIDCNCKLDAPSIIAIITKPKESENHKQD